MDGRALRRLLTGYMPLMTLDDYVAENGPFDGLSVLQQFDNVRISPNLDPFIIIKLDTYFIVEFGMSHWLMTLQQMTPQEAVKRFIEAKQDQLTSAQNRYENPVSAYIDYLDTTDSKLLPSAINELHGQIPDSYKRQFLLDIYVARDYVAPELSKGVWQDLEQAKTEAEQAEIESDLAEYAVNGKLKVYRGIGSASTPLRNGFYNSWTVDPLVAKKFSEGLDGASVMVAEVSLDKVLAWLPERDESEVLAKPDDLKRL